jgi:hypothetical protein
MKFFCQFLIMSHIHSFPSIYTLWTSFMCVCSLLSPFSCRCVDRSAARSLDGGSRPAPSDDHVVFQSIVLSQWAKSIELGCMLFKPVEKSVFFMNE